MEKEEKFILQIIQKTKISRRSNMEKNIRKDRS
jgi:hypothetical protein